MIDKIFRTFFSKNKSNDKITILKNREISQDFVALNTNRLDDVKLDRVNCLSKYFKNRKGLNVKERLGSYLSRAQNLQ